MFNKQNKRFISDCSDEFGSISWVVSSRTYGPAMDRNHGKESTLRLSDCYKVINLEFDYDNHAEYQQRLEKVDTLINELADFRAALVESWGKL